MKVYNENGDSMNAAKEQMEILLENGWSCVKPEVKEESEPEVDESKVDESKGDGPKGDGSKAPKKVVIKKPKK